MVNDTILESYTSASDVRPRAPSNKHKDHHHSTAPLVLANPEPTQIRKTKLVCTIGPATSSRDDLFKLCDAGMNVARLNMSHGDHASHKAVVDLVKEYNSLNRTCVGLMLDTKGPEVRSSDLAEPIQLKRGDKFVFTIQEGQNGTGGRISVNYDGFIDDVSVGDVLLVDGGLLSFQVVEKSGPDVTVEALDSGVMESRRHLNVRGKSATLPAITEKDWLDLQFGVDVGVDYYALSFVKDAQVIYEVKKWLAEQGARHIGVLAKIESADSVKNLEGILDAVDGAMVARGDLGAELPVEEVPYWQAQIVQGCRRRGKPVIVATNMLESMIKNATPTRAEVSDIAIAVREGSDAVMLSGETAYGRFPLKAVATQATVAMKTELSMTKYLGARRFGSEEAPAIDWIQSSSRKSSSHSPDTALPEMFAYHATTMANTTRSPLMVFSRQGNMPSLLSHYRPDYPIFAFTDNELVQRKLALYHGVIALRINFRDTADATFDAAMVELAGRGYLTEGQMVAIVQSGKKPIWRTASTHTIQVRKVEKWHLPKAQQSMDD